MRPISDLPPAAGSQRRTARFCIRCYMRTVVCKRHGAPDLVVWHTRTFTDCTLQQIRKQGWRRQLRAVSAWLLRPGKCNMMMDQHKVSFSTHSASLCTTQARAVGNEFKSCRSDACAAALHCHLRRIAPYGLPGSPLAMQRPYTQAASLHTLPCMQVLRTVDAAAMATWQTVLSLCVRRWRPQSPVTSRRRSAVHCRDPQRHNRASADVLCRAGCLT